MSDDSFLYQRPRHYSASELSSPPRASNRHLRIHDAGYQCRMMVRELAKRRCGGGQKPTVDEFYIDATELCCCCIAAFTNARRLDLMLSGSVAQTASSWPTSTCAEGWPATTSGRGAVSFGGFLFASPLAEASVTVACPFSSRGGAGSLSMAVVWSCKPICV